MKVKKEKKLKPSIKTDPLISFVVPVYQVPPQVLKRCLLSLADQDYPRVEVVIVLDGPDKISEEIAKSFLNRDGWKLKIIEHQGACVARNEGFKETTGEIVSFFNSDYVANPGMIQLWVDSLLEHPDCGFVYGAYEYASSNRMAYASKEFDTYQLDVANYIDCGFPLWRKYVVEWDKECKSLQDWDFWLRVIKKHNVKGHYLGRDISFVAELPREKGLSMDSSENWVDRIKYVKEKNQIEIRDICVASVGAPNHGIQIAKMIGADFRDDTIFKPHEYKGLYLIGWFMRPDQRGNDHPEILSHFRNAKKVVHFIGADIYWLRKFPWESLKYLSGALNLKTDAILCETEEAQKELADFGIKSHVVPIPPYSTMSFMPLPEKKRVAFFATERTDFDKYLLDHTLSVVRACPDIQFSAYGDGANDFTYPNFRHYGNLDRKQWEDFIKNHTCLMRFCRHDTLPLAGVEFLMAGRRFITNMRIPYADVVDTSGKEDLNQWDIHGSGFNDFHWPETKKAIVQKVRKAVSKPQMDHLASDFYTELMDRDRYFKSLSYYFGFKVGKREKGNE